MKVGELAENLAKRNETRFIAPIADFKFADDCSTVTIEGKDRQFMMDEKTTAVLAKFFKIPVKYINECPAAFRAQTFAFWRDQKAGAEIVVEAIDDQVTSLYSTRLMMLPVMAIAQMVERVFDPEAEVHDLIRTEKMFHLDVTSNLYTVEVDNPNGIPGRPEVGDITSGGVRFLATPNKVASPSVGRFFRRAVCSNGMTTTESAGRISIKGLSVTEVIESMEEAAERILSDMDERLEDYRKTAEIPIPGHPLSFAEQLGAEMEVPAKVLHGVLDQVRQLPEEGVTVYDINQAFTSQAARVRTYKERTRLQVIGGALALDAQHMINRCDKCEKLLVG